MSYVITLSNGNQLTTVADGTVDNTSSSLNLIGKSYSGYGALIAENMVHTLENFANATAPNAPLIGQLWYNTTAQTMMVYNGQTWASTGLPVPAVNTGYTFADHSVTVQEVTTDNAGFILYDPAAPTNSKYFRMRVRDDGVFAGHWVLESLNDNLTLRTTILNTDASGFISLAVSPDSGDNSTAIATTAFVKQHLNSLGGTGTGGTGGGTGGTGGGAGGTLDIVRTPTNLSPSDGVSLTTTTPTLTASTYYSLYNVPQGGAQFQISPSSDFSNVSYDSGTLVGTIQTFTVPSNTLGTNQTYYWRCRYLDNEGTPSEYSTPTSFSVAQALISTPFITSPTASATVTLPFTVTSSAFTVSFGTDTQVSASWEIWTNGGGVLVWASEDDKTNLTSITVPSGALPAGTSFYVMVRYKGQSLGYSSWSQSVSFMTAASTPGTNWLVGTLPEARAWTSAAFANGRFAAHGPNASALYPATIAESLTGVSGWTLPSCQPSYKIMGAGTLFLTTSNSNSTISASSDLTTWSNLGFKMSNPSTLVYGSNGYVLIDSEPANAGWRTMDGVSWYTTNITGVYGNRTVGAAFGNNTYVIVANSPSNTGIYWTSSDGIHWSQNTLPGSNVHFGSYWPSNEPQNAVANGVIYAGGYFVTVAQPTDGTSNLTIAYSSNGTAWASQVAAKPSAGFLLSGIAYSQGNYYILGYDSTPSVYCLKAASSPATNWTTVSMPASSLQVRDIAVGNGAIIAVGQVNGGGNSTTSYLYSNS